MPIYRRMRQLPAIGGTSVNGTSIGRTAIGPTSVNRAEGGVIPLVVLLVLIVLAAGCTIARLADILPPTHWLSALMKPDLRDMRGLLVTQVLLPRLGVSILAGAALALAGTLTQQVLRNPLAEPTTLGISAGAYLAVATAAFFAPSLLADGREWVAVLGGCAAIGLVAAIAGPGGLSSSGLILAGLVVNLLLGAVGTALVLFNDGLRTLSVWSSGSLDVQGWDVLIYLALRLPLVAIGAAALSRSLVLLELGDSGARALGLPLNALRLLAMALSILLASFVVSAVGVIGFVGFAAPILARLAGARRLGQRLIWAPLLGAALLWLADEVVQLAGPVTEMPTGAAISLLGAPLLFWLLSRVPAGRGDLMAAVDGRLRRQVHPWRFLAALGSLLVIFAAISLAAGRGIDGWHWSDWREVQSLLFWRLPRLGAALASGAMLGAAGMMVQRLTGNTMASPEVLGISSGAALGIVALIIFMPDPDRVSRLIAATSGAGATLVGLLMMSRRAGFEPSRLLLTGVALNAVFSSLVAILMVTDDGHFSALFDWLMGSTYLVRPVDAMFIGLTALVLLASACLCLRWLTILPLGASTITALGLDPRGSRGVVVVIAALLIAVGTIIVGPLSFVGLLAPHMARMLGLQRAATHLLGAALLGAIVMVIADWLGRFLLFPDQMPAGLLASLIGGPYLIWLMWRKTV